MCLLSYYNLETNTVRFWIHPEIVSVISLKVDSHYGAGHGQVLDRARTRSGSSTRPVRAGLDQNTSTII